MKHKTFFYSLLLLAGFCLTSSLSASDCCEKSECCKKKEPPCFYLNIDFLMEKACIDDLEYAAVRTSTSPTTFIIKSIDPDWAPAFRVQAGSERLFCGWDVRGSYLYRKIDDENRVSTDPDAVVTPLIHPDLAAIALGDTGVGAIDAEYHEWDFLVGTDILCPCTTCHRLVVRFGLAGIYFDQSVTSTLLDDSSGEVTQTIFNSEFWGLGFRLGSKYSWQLCENWALFAEGYISILAGEADNYGYHDDDDSGVSPDFVYSDESICQIVPGYQLNFGFEYEYCGCNVPVMFKLAYEFQQWQNIPNHRIFVGDSSADNDGTVSTSANVRTMGFHGVTLGIGLAY